MTEVTDNSKRRGRPRVTITLIDRTCSCCDRVFATKGIRVSHEMHKGVMPNRCPAADRTCTCCGREWKTKSHMKTHMNSKKVLGIPHKPRSGRPSSGAVPDTTHCDICNREFCDKWVRRRHMKNVHPSVDASTNIPTSPPETAPAQNVESSSSSSVRGSIHGQSDKSSSELRSSDDSDDSEL